MALVVAALAVPAGARAAEPPPGAPADPTSTTSQEPAVTTAAEPLATTDAPTQSGWLLWSERSYGPAQGAAAPTEPAPAAQQPADAPATSPAQQDEPQPKAPAAAAKPAPAAATGEPASAPSHPNAAPPPVTTPSGGVEAPGEPAPPTAADAHGRPRLLTTQAHAWLRRVQIVLDRTRRSVETGATEPSSRVRRQLQTSFDALAPILDELAPLLREAAPPDLAPDLERLRHELARASRSAGTLLAALERSGASGPAVEQLRAQLLWLRLRAAQAAATAAVQPQPWRPIALSELDAVAYTQVDAPGQSLSRPAVSADRAASVTRPSRGSRGRDAPGGRRVDSTPPATGVAASASASGAAASTSVPAALVAVLLGLLAPALTRRLEGGLGGWRPPAFVAALERPG